MGWTETDLTGISTEMERIADGTYVFSVLRGTKYNTWDPAKVEVPVKIEEGEFAGRITYPSYPDPDKKDWSLAAFKRLTNALEADGATAMLPMQDPVEYLNQEGVVGKRFVAPLVLREYEKQDGTKGAKEDIKLFKVKSLAAA